MINACEPDVVLLQEATSPEVVRALASTCGMKQWAANRGDSLAFMSREQVAHYGWHSVLLGRRRYLEVIPSGNKLRIFGVHLSAIHSNLTEWRRTYEVRFLLSQIAQYDDPEHLVMGDFNTLAKGEELDLRRLPPRLRALRWMLGGTIRWRTIGLMLDAGYVDCFRALHKEDAGATFPVGDPHIRLDYMFAPAALVPSVKRCEVVREVEAVRLGSDHYPLLAEVDRV